MENNIREKALKHSIIDGAFASIMAALVGGIFLTGFALKILNAQAKQLGILASLPMFANLIQLFGSYIIEKTGKKKYLCFSCAVLSRSLWIIVILLPLQLFSSYMDFRIWILVGVIGCSSILGSLSGVAWLAWMSELVPEEIRGSYFGKRNMIASSASMIAVLAGGKLISFWEKNYTESSPYGFMIIFLIGIVSGIISSWYVAQIPDTKSENNSKSQNNGIAMFFEPFKNKNFLILTLYVSVWSFGAQIAGPFYGMFMIENLNINFSTITFLGTIATLSTLFMMKIWGPMSDRLGNKPILLVSGTVLLFTPILWTISNPKTFFIPILSTHIIAGAFTAGISLSHFNILIKLSPKEGRSIYLAVFAAITGFIGALAPIFGGYLSEMLVNFKYNIFAFPINNLHLIFYLSSIIQFLSMFIILKVKEPKSSSPVAVIMQLQNDLNPQTGVASTADFIMVEVEKGENLLKKIDKVTDDLADKSEGIIENIWNKIARLLEKALSKIKDFLTKDD